jgi:membrane protein
LTKLERIILQTRPVAFIIHKSKQIVLPGFYGVPLYDAFRFFLKQIKRVGLNERASAISFNFIMAIPAACICVFTLVPYLPVSKQFTAELLRLTRDLTPNQNTYNFVNTFLEDFLNTERGGLLSFTFLLVIFYASNAMLTVMRTFDKSIYQYAKQESFIKKRWRAIKLTVIVLGLMIGVILVLIGQSMLFDLMLKWLNIKGSGVIWAKVLRWIITITLFFYGIALIYKFAPSVKKRWSTLSPGSILATFLTILTTYLFSFWVNNFGDYNKVYGSIGTVLILMFLIYINSLILLIGFELNVSITYLKAEADERRQKEMAGLIETEVLPKLSNQNLTK